MTGFTFALVALLGVPFAVLGLLVLAHRLTPPAIWKTLPVQALAFLGFLSCIGLPVAIMLIDSQGEYFDDETALVGEAFGLPEGVTVNRQGDKTLRLGDCWRNSVNWQSEVIFADAAGFDRWLAAQGFRQGITRQVAGYFGQTPERVSIAPGALDLLPRDPQYVLSDGRDSYQRNVRILQFYQPFVCTAIDRAADGSITLRRCDPIADGGDAGNAGQVIVNPDAKKRTLEGRIYYASGPATCTNPVRRAVNNTLGLPHPDGGEPNTLIGGALPFM
jgi:hypothetical protein